VCVSTSSFVYPYDDKTKTASLKIGFITTGVCVEGGGGGGGINIHTQTRRPPPRKPGGIPMREKSRVRSLAVQIQIGSHFVGKLQGALFTSDRKVCQKLSVHQKRTISRFVERLMVLLQNKKNCNTKLVRKLLNSRNCLVHLQFTIHWSDGVAVAKTHGIP